MALICPPNRLPVGSCREDGTLPDWLSYFLDWIKPFQSGLLPNPFSQPPEAIVRHGMEAVKEYCKDLRHDHIAECRDLKVVIIGEAGAGKTR